MIKKFLNNIRITLRGMKLLYHIERLYTIIYIIESILKPINVYVNIYMMARIIDLISTHTEYSILFQNIIIIVLLNFIISISQSAISRLRMYHMEQLIKNEKSFFAEKTMKLKYPYIEDANITFLRNKIENESRSGYNMFYLNVFIGRVITSLSNFVYSFSLSVTLLLNRNMSLWLRILILLILAGCIYVNFWTAKHSNKITRGMFQEMVPHNTLLNFYGRYMDNYNAGKDIRLYHLQSFILDINKKAYDGMNTISAKARDNGLKYSLLNSVMNNLLKVSIYVIVLYLCVYGNLSVGAITKYVASISLFVKSIGDIVNSVQSLFNNNKYLQTYFEYMDLSESDTDSGNIAINSKEFNLEFMNVSFRYPNEKDFVLKDISFKINNGETVALVGENGCGKTTLIKLICRFYEPQQGKILLNGKDIKQYDYAEYIGILSSVFQDFPIFGFTLAQNIALCDKPDMNRVEEAIDKVELTSYKNKLEKGLDTYLKNEYESGYEISGGESQKVALARALYKQCSAMLLDEPTSALDPQAEYDVIYNMKKNLDGLTGLFVSHRLGACKFSDKILVLDKGRLVQEGEHNTLVKDSNGKYYRLWAAQAQYYVN